MNEISAISETSVEVRSRLFDRFASPGIAAPTVPCPAHETGEKSKRPRGEIGGTSTRKLLLRDEKVRLLPFSIHEDRALEPETLHQRVGANGGLGVGPPERMIALPGVQTGALTRSDSSTIASARSCGRLISWSSSVPANESR